MSYANQYRVLLLAASLLLVACNRGDDLEPPTTEDEIQSDSTEFSQTLPTETTQSDRDLPETMQDTLQLEGMPEPIMLKLFQTPEGFGAPFYTYYPDDFVVQVIPSDIGQTVRFTANFGGTLTDNAVVELFIYPPGNTLQTVREQVEGLSQDWRRSAEAERRYAWSVDEFVFAGDELVGRYAFGERNERFFHVLTAYPPEMGDGFPARAGIILEHLRWLNDASPLG